MSILFSNEILDSVKNELSVASKSIQIISAYCKKSTLMYLNDFISDDVIDKKLLVRFRMDDIVKGSTDFSILEYAISEGWTPFIRFDLHAKTYIVDGKRGLVGSANATNSGLSLGKTGNMEMATLIEIEPQDLKKIDALFKNAIEVNSDLIEELKSQLKNVDSIDQKGSFVWDASITSLFCPKVETLFSYEFPDMPCFKKGDYISFLDEIYTGNDAKIKELFRSSNCYLWLIQTLKENDGEIYFGKLSACLHEVLVSDPKPYRKDVKQMLSNLLNLTAELKIEEIIIDRPNYSQRIRLSSL